MMIIHCLLLPAFLQIKGEGAFILNEEKMIHDGQLKQCSMGKNELFNGRSNNE